MNGSTNPVGTTRRAPGWIIAMAIALAAMAAGGCARPASSGSKVSTTPVATTERTASPSDATEPKKEPKKEKDANGTASPTPSASATDPYALADGVYPAFIRDVDVSGRTITVDVVQTFEGWQAKQAALEDGLAPWKAEQYKYAPVYIRNENPLLRTLSVSPTVTVEFWGACEDVEHGPEGLRELAERALPFSTDWYYSLTMRDDVVQRVVQKIAIPAC